MTSLLIIGNDSETSATLLPSFGKLNYETAVVHSGRQALAFVRHRSPDIILVDTLSLRSDATRLARSLHSETYALIVFLAANSRQDGFGADLVLQKALPPRRIAARVQAAFENKPPHTLQVGSLELDLEKRRVTRGSRHFSLTPKEFHLLKLFMERPGQIITRKILMKEVWETEYLGDTRTLDVHIRWLREKIEENPGKPRRVLTIRGQGYMLIKPGPP